jgi:nitrogen-specific signal transduction histidine kinase
VKKSDTASRQALADRLCLLAHDLNNGLGVIAGYCELLSEHAEPESECAKRLRLILEVVYRLAKRINGHECRMVACAAQNSDPTSEPQETASQRLLTERS